MPNIVTLVGNRDSSFFSTVQYGLIVSKATIVRKLVENQIKTNHLCEVEGTTATSSHEDLFINLVLPHLTRPSKT